MTENPCLAAALDGMDARIRTADSPDGVRFPCDAEFLGGVELLNLQTCFGDLDLSYVPAGTEGFDDLARNAVEMAIQGSSATAARTDGVRRRTRAASSAALLRGLSEGVSPSDSAMSRCEYLNLDVR